MHESRTRPATRVRSNCPECDAGLKVLSIISGRAGSEYWTMRCIKCGGIHLDILKAASPSASPSPSPAA